MRYIDIGTLAACALLAGCGGAESQPTPRAVPAAEARQDRDRVRGTGVVGTPEGPRRVSSALRVPGRMDFGQFAWSDVGGSAPVWVRIDLGRQMLSVFRGPDEIGTAVVLFGTDGKPTPKGAFRVLERDADHRSSLYDAAMPYMLRLTADGVAIHASEVRSGSATHGCVGVPIGFARLLYGVVRRGDVVYVA